VQAHLSGRLNKILGIYEVNSMDATNRLVHVCAAYRYGVLSLVVKSQQLVQVIGLWVFLVI
jgi:hypothetical protein